MASKLLFFKKEILTGRSVIKQIDMSPRTPQQFEEIREGKKLLIMETALELFANEGFHSTSIQDIAKKADISKGLLYNYFESKEELIRIIIAKGLEEIMTYFDPNHDGMLTKQEIKYFIKETFRILEENLEFWKLYFAILTQPPVLKLVDKVFQETIQSLFRMVERYFEQLGDENPEASARVFIALLDGIGIYYVLDPENFPLESVKQKIIELYAHE